MFWCCCGGDASGTVRDGVPLGADFEFWDLSNTWQWRTDTGGLLTHIIRTIPGVGLVETYKGFAFQWPEGDMTLSLASASVTFNGESETTFPEAELRLRVSSGIAATPSFGFGNAAQLISSFDWIIPASETWGATPGVPVTTPDLASIINAATSHPSYNPVTTRVWVLLRPTTIQAASTSIRRLGIWDGVLNYTL